MRLAASTIADQILLWLKKILPLPSSEQHVLMHLALKHQKIIEFVPQEVSELFYPIGATTTATEDSQKNSTDKNELAVVHRKICKKDKKSTENSPGNTDYDVKFCWNQYILLEFT